MNAFQQRLVEFREKKAFSQLQLAEIMGVTRVTIVRWENGTAKPSPLAASKLGELGFGDVRAEETTLTEMPLRRLKGSKAEGEKDFEKNINLAGVNEIQEDTGKTRQITPAPYVINGPANQIPLFEEMFKWQGLSKSILKGSWERRLSGVKSLDNGVTTAQYQLEEPKNNAAHWDPNYGTHGWHRYIGRFPPHLIRAIINYFGAQKNHVVLDPFAGSGTTLVECRLLGVPAVGVDICPLSAMITRAKSQFPENSASLKKTSKKFVEYFTPAWMEVTGMGNPDMMKTEDLLAWDQNIMESFPNIDKWLSGSALAGIIISLAFAKTLKGYEQDAFLTALSGKMRSIGNLDVDVARAEYSKVPRKNVNTNHLVMSALKGMTTDLENVFNTHSDFILPSDTITVLNEDILHVDKKIGDIDYIITSPPYGVEATSYLRTHLLSYRCLKPFLKEDPYDFGERVIGSEYVSEKANTKPNFAVWEISKSFKMFFDDCLKKITKPGLITRCHMMMDFFDDMYSLFKKFNRWLKKKGKIAFVIGNKRIDQWVIPTDKIIIEIAESCGLRLFNRLTHKLKCNNTNSQVPWQERIIQEEAILFFEKEK